MNTTVIGNGRRRLSSHLLETGHALVAGLRRHALLYVLAISAELIALAVAYSVDRMVDTRMVLLFSLPILTILFVSILWCVIRETYRLWRSGYEGSAIKALGRMFVNDLLAAQRVANFFHACVALSLFMSAFTSLKILLPAINPFEWDVAFAEWDRILHFGMHPYQILQPVLGHPFMTTSLNFGYNMWFFLLFSSWIWLGGMTHDSAVRQRFLVAFMLTWFLGTNVLGTLLSSVGPAFYDRLLDGQDPYEPLMTYLRGASQVSPVWALEVQDLLWEGYVSGDSPVIGISAMPSMHVGNCILLILVAFASGRTWLGWAAVAYAVVIFLGSIHLAWHYAIDGYAGALVALAGWYLAGRLVAWDRKRQGFADA